MQNQRKHALIVKNATHLNQHLKASFVKFDCKTTRAFVTNMVGLQLYHIDSKAIAPSFLNVLFPATIMLSVLIQVKCFRILLKTTIKKVSKINKINAI